MVKRLGVANTVVFHNGKTKAYNSDCFGFSRALEVIGVDWSALKSVCVLGSGGVARAIVSELLNKKLGVKVLSRNQDSLENLKKIFGRPSLFTGELKPENLEPSLLESDLLVQTTPVGMYPNVSDTLVGEEVFRRLNNKREKQLVVFDAAANPVKTKFLSLAEVNGHLICSGLWMLIYQGVKSFELWTGLRVPDNEFMELFEILKKNLLEIIRILCLSCCI